MDRIIEQIARELGKEPRHVENVVRLMDEGNTIPFIARYRKELHGAMDDTSLRTLEERLKYLRGLEERRESVKKSIADQGKLTEELSAALDGAETLAQLEDLYRPYKQKRRTRATIAREKGLAPLAELLFAQRADCPPPMEAAAAYVDAEKGVETAEDALCGASCGRCWRKTPCCTARRPRRRTRSTGSTTSSPRPSPSSRATRCWPSTGASGRKS